VKYQGNPPLTINVHIKKMKDRKVKQFFSRSGNSERGWAKGKGE
jgi:hypothetical protein